MTAGTTTGISGSHVGRYVLDDLVANSSASELWRATDEALQRHVGVRLIASSDPRAEQIKKAATAAAKVHDRRLVQVLDVIEAPDYVAVITEWVPGRSWSEYLSEPWAAHDAAVVAYEVGRALQAAHRHGVTHGRIRPASVIITDTNEVRLRGLGVDAALYGVAPPGDPRVADLHGIGAIIFAALTTKWPDPHPTASQVDDLDVIGPVAGSLPAPSDLMAGVPADLSAIAARCLLSATPPRGKWPFPDLEHAVAALARSLEEVPEEDPAQERQESTEATADRAVRRTGVLAVALLVIAALVLLGIQLTRNSGESNTEANPAPPAPTADAEVDPVQPVPLRALPVVSVADFDPGGSDGTENPDLVPFASDNDPSTAWRTVRYKSSDMNPKTGTGLLVDLGLARPISEISLELLGNNTDLEIRIAQQAGASPDDYELLTGAVAVGSEITLRTPSPVATRYVLIWMTNLPFQDGAYEGGVREFVIRG